MFRHESLKPKEFYHIEVAITDVMSLMRIVDFFEIECDPEKSMQEAIDNAYDEAIERWHAPTRGFEVVSAKRIVRYVSR